MIFTQNTKISESKNRKIDQNEGWSRPFGLKICEIIDFDAEKNLVISILSESIKKNPKETSKIPLRYFAYGFGAMKPMLFSKQSKFLNIDIPYLYKNRLEELNAIFGQQQIESIANTLNLIDNNKYERLENLKKINIQKCISWCQRYKLPYNKIITTTNIFLSKNSKEF